MRQTTELHITGMTCAACAARIEKVLSRQQGLVASVSFANESALIEHDSEQHTLDTLIGLVEKAGYHAERQTDELEQSPTQPAIWPLILAAVLCFPLLFDMIAMSAGWHEWMVPPLWQWLAATPVQFVAGWRFYRGAWHALKSGGANMDVLVALGTTAAWAYSSVVAAGWLDGHLYFEGGAVVIALVLLGKLLEDNAKRQTHSALYQLAQLRPKTARIWRDNQWHNQDARLLKPGDVIQIEAGEAIPADSAVLEGSSAVDESLLTGESLPVDKKTGSALYAGTLNQSGWLKAQVTVASHDSQLAHIIRLVRQAQGSKAPIQALADRISGIFVPVVLVIALTTLIGWWIWGGQFEPALINAVSVLVIACPCALGLATPTAVIVASGRAAKLGILLKNASALEAASKLTHLALDKTGTLTQGKPVVSQGDFRDIPAMLAMAQASQHPLSQALARHLSTLGPSPIALRRQTQFAGKGLEAEREDGQVIRLGSPQWIAETGVNLPEFPHHDGSVVVAADSQAILGWALLADPLREDAASVLGQLKTAGIEVAMLTGDRPEAAEAIARQLPLAYWQGHCLPADKAAFIRNWRNQAHIVGMAGDGVNDAPALAEADISFAIGTGAEAAIASADITLQRPDVAVLRDALWLARAAMRKIHQNLFFAFIYNVVGIPLAALGLLNPMLAGAAMALSSVSVVSNALLLKRWQPPAN